ncbi:pyridine nucleotide-disulfide oxidoreductase domain-containing protein 1 [Schistocerca piceifrons]|uniref:pyridine nucleotide-disulfide oxidoreductase domain-containing protein 1 n=1 Tax=Schistocerca piceifrons TaxID=274613 RepID=UPI001F5EB970|nr:pyridine nucleotide-disulfide oxidoreductase domain-containing protein 1 [Schistocerca piceifrons]XP_049962872.1 pyridine nucleotide-disulfide oxidoreductase domain-containing protein 1 [Schistocerca serialis cubense]
MEEPTYVIVGGGIAGVSCAESLSFYSPGEKCLLITASPVIKAAANVTALTKTLTEFEVEERDVHTLIETYPSISVIEDIVVDVDAESHRVHTKQGRTVEYKKLCICSGGYPKLIDKNNPYVIGIRDTESVEQFEKRVKNSRRILVVGNGGIATEIVHEIKGLEKIWVIRDNHISAPFIDPGAAAFFQEEINKKGKNNQEKSVVKRMKYTLSKMKLTDERGAALGPDWHLNFNISGSQLENSKVTVEYNCEIKQILTADEYHLKYNSEESDWPVFAELTNGIIYGCDFIVSATGVIPNTSFVKDLKDIDFASDGGLKVDWKMETSVPDIFAAGDVCTASWPHAFHWFQMRLWTQARQMGSYAGKCMAASITNEEIMQDFCFELFSHVTKFFGYKVILLGLFNGQKLNSDYELLVRVTKGNEYIKLVIKDGKVHGAVLIGETDLEEMCENLILNQLDVSVYGEDLLNPDIDIEDYFD